MTKESKKHVCQNNHSQILLLGLIAGGLIGAGTALVLAPKNGKQLRKNLIDACQGFSDKTGEIKENLFEQGEELLEAAQQWSKKKKISPTSSQLALGGIAGCALGAAVALFLANKSKDEDSSYFPDISSKVESWTTNAKSVVDTLHGFLNEGNAKKRTAAHDESDGSPFHEIMDLASIGLRLFQNLKQK